MAEATTTSFGKFRIKIGDGADPETFAEPCGFTQKSYSRSKQMNETAVPDCADPDKASEIQRDVVSRSASVSGSGVLAAESVAAWNDFYDSSVSKNCKIEMTIGGQVYTWTQKFHLESFEVTAEKGNKVKVSVQMSSDGGYTSAVVPA